LVPTNKSTFTVTINYEKQYMQNHTNANNRQQSKEINNKMGKTYISLDFYFRG
jgi:hypothetical protein